MVSVVSSPLLVECIVVTAVAVVEKVQVVLWTGVLGATKKGKKKISWSSHNQNTRLKCLSLFHQPLGHDNIIFVVGFASPPAQICLYQYSISYSNAVCKDAYKISLLQVELHLGTIHTSHHVTCCADFIFSFKPRYPCSSLQVLLVILDFSCIDQQPVIFIQKSL